MSIIGGCNLAICHRSAILHLLSFLLSGIQYTLNTAPSLPTLKISFNSPYQILLNSRSILCQYLVLSACDALSPCDAVAGMVRCGVRPRYDHISVSVLVQVPGPTIPITITSHFHPVLSPAAASSPQTSHHTSQHGDFYLSEIIAV